MNRRDYDRFNWGFNRPKFDDFDEGREAPEEEIPGASDPQPAGYGFWGGPPPWAGRGGRGGPQAERGFGRGRGPQHEHGHEERGPQRGRGPQQRPERGGPRAGFERGGFSPPPMWGPAFRYGPRMGAWAFRRGWGAFGPAFRRNFEGVPGWGPPPADQEMNLDGAIAQLEHFEGRLQQRLGRVKQRLEALRAERVRRQEGRSQPTQGVENAPKSSDTDISML